jgi:hypothetical protein
MKKAIIPLPAAAPHSVRNATPGRTVNAPQTPHPDRDAVKPVRLRFLPSGIPCGKFKFVTKSLHNTYKVMTDE